MIPSHENKLNPPQLALASLEAFQYAVVQSNKSSVVQRLQQLTDSFYKKYQQYRDAFWSDRAQNDLDYSAVCMEKNKRYWQWYRRASNLSDQIMECKRGCHATANKRSDAQWDYERRLEAKKKGKEKFLRLHTYAPWFFSNSVGADYGTYVCDKCERTFYHSPSTIKRAAKVIYNCCCGHCTNGIIHRDYGETPFTR